MSFLFFVCFVREMSFVCVRTERSDVLTFAPERLPFRFSGVTVTVDTNSFDQASEEVPVHEIPTRRGFRRAAPPFTLVSRRSVLRASPQRPAGKGGRDAQACAVPLAFGLGDVRAPPPRRAHRAPAAAVPRVRAGFDFAHPVSQLAGLLAPLAAPGGGRAGRARGPRASQGGCQGPAHRGPLRVQRAAGAGEPAFEGGGDRARERDSETGKGGCL